MCGRFYQVNWLFVMIDEIINLIYLYFNCRCISSMLCTVTGVMTGNCYCYVHHYIGNKTVISWVFVNSKLFSLGIKDDIWNCCPRPLVHIFTENLDKSRNIITENLDKAKNIFTDNLDKTRNIFTENLD
jgi:hypothetical protein